MSDKETLGEGRRQIGMKLRAAREEAEMDLADLSVRTGFSEEEIEAIENGVDGISDGPDGALHGPEGGAQRHRRPPNEMIRIPAGDGA